MDDIRKALSSLDSVEAPDLWPEIERRASVPETDMQRGTGRFESMFSVTKFLVAGAIVALFGGFLLAGVLTQPGAEPVPAAGASASAGASPSPETTVDIRDLEWRPLELDEDTFGSGAHLVDVTASDTMLVIGGSLDGDAAVWTSTDGLDWTLVPQDEAVFGGVGRQEIKAVAPWRDGFVAAGEVRGSGDFDPLTVAAVWISDDGTTWARVPHDEDVFGGVGRQEVFDIAATGDRIVIDGFDEEGPNAGTGSGSTLWTSSDGLRWEQSAAPGYASSITTGPQGFISVGTGVWRSNDGVTWELADTLGGDIEMDAVASGPGTLVAIGGLDGDLAAWYSPDGIAWELSTIDTPVPEPDREAEWQPSDVAASESGFATVIGPWDGPEDSAIIVSPDGKTWVAANAPDTVADAALTAIAGFGSHFVALGGLGGWAGDPALDPPRIWTTIEPESSR